MSAFQKKDSRNAANKAVNAPFCKVCHDAGKPESEYTSHFVKSAPGADGVVVCPTLLAQQCGYCHTAGHTVSYCKLLKQHQKAKEHYNRKSEFLETKTKTAVQEPKKNKSAFAALAEDSDDEIDAKVVKQAMCPFPALCEIKHVQKSNAISYAVMASKPATDAFADAQVQPKKTKTKTKTIVTHDVRRRWVDMMDDSDDDDDDDDVMSVSEISNDCW
jgi:L-rhamnose mutarotase